MRKSQFIFLMKKNNKIERCCDISTQTDGVDYIYKYADENLEYDADTDNMSYNYLVKKRKRREHFKSKNIMIKQKIIKKKKERSLTSLNCWIICLCLLIYIGKNKIRNDVSLDSRINVTNIEKNKVSNTSLKKTYVPAISFKELWKEELSKFRII
jgi:hypothetical protein